MSLFESPLSFGFVNILQTLGTVKQRSAFLHSFMSCQWSGSSRNHGFSVVRAFCSLGLEFCDVQLLHLGKPGWQEGLF